MLTHLASIGSLLLLLFCNLSCTTTSNTVRTNNYDPIPTGVISFHDSGAKFSPNGKQIAFYGLTEDKNYEIHTMNADGTNIINLTNDLLEDYSPEWSRDGKWIAYTSGT